MTEEKEKKGYDLQAKLDKLAPKVIQEKVFDPHREAHHKARSDKHKVHTHAEFSDEIIKFVKKYKKDRDNHAPDDHRAYGEAKRLLGGLFEKHGGYEGAYELAMEGKLDEVLKALANHYESSEHNDYVTELFRDIDPHDSAAHEDIANKVITMYKPFLPKGVETDAKALAPSYEGLIDNVRKLSDQAVHLLEKKKPGKKPEKKVA